jgi:hypothetical protein
VIPDMEKVVSDYLRADPNVQAVASRIVGKTPATTTEPWVRVTQLDAANDPTSRVEHLIAYLMQFDCYAGSEGGQPEANLLGRIVRASLILMPGVHDSVVVSSTRIVSDPRIPDTDFEPARERRILTARIHAHA